MGWRVTIKGSLCLRLKNEFDKETTLNDLPDLKILYFLCLEWNYME